MTEKNIKNDISLIKTEENYPEFPYGEKSHLYDALIDLLEGLGLSRENSFSSYVKPGQTALIKPNWVRDHNPLGHNIDSLITHSSIIKYLIDLLVTAMDGNGRIIIADAPLQNCNFDNLKKQTRIEEVIANAQKDYPNMEILLEDWRITTMESSDLNKRNVQKYRLTNDDELSKEYNIIDLSKESFLEDISKYADKFRVTKYKSSLILRHHSKGKHEYLITKRIFEVDFFINLPKLKTHIKAGLTCAMKNLVGINGHKEFLPHHIKGAYFEGGDNYCNPSWLRAKYEDLYDYVWENVNSFSVFKRKILMTTLQFLWSLSNIFGAENISAGSWMGNDTIWRTTLDLNHIAYFNSVKPYKILNIVDGIIAGEGEGPLTPTPKSLGILIAGENPAYVDAIAAKMMGYTLSRIPTVYNAIYHRKSKFFKNYPEDLTINFTDGNTKKEINFSQIPEFNFKKPFFWKGA